MLISVRTDGHACCKELREDVASQKSSRLESGQDYAMMSTLPASKSDSIFPVVFTQLVSCSLRMPPCHLA